ncbi:MAG: acetylxylan esterase, partial [Planctomycetota bacterium]|nr:acetylxylan esterase [Planctomycetota bacterium]
SGVALQVKHRLWGGILKAPDGKNRLALAIRCKGMAANNIDFLYDTRHASDNLLVFPQVEVTSPTMGQGDPGYKPQSNGWWCLYEKDAQVDYIFTFGWLGKEQFRGKAVIAARHALGQPHFRLEAAPEKIEDKDGIAQYRASLRPKFSLPGVSEMELYLLDEQGAALYVNRLRFLYDWPSYQPTYNTPPDMKEFWDKTLAELRAIPLDPKVENQHFKDDPKWEFYHVSFASWKGQRIHALLYVPKEAKKPCPAILTAHPGTLGWGVNTRPDGVYGSEVKCDPRFVTIVPLIRGHEPDAKDVPFNQPWWGPLDSRDDYVARAWFCALVRAVDYLATRPELVDIKRVVAMGGSQGGALALVAAALDQRIAACLSDCPSNCMHHDAVRPGTYGTFGPTAGQVPAGQTLEDLLRTLSYYDPAHMAPWIKCPTVIHINVGDLTVHCMGPLGVFKNLTGLPEDKKWFFPGCNSTFHGGSF